ncbi:MAG: hypothetical protein WAW92_01425 [Minisyncoccia bacterium]
MTRGYFLLAVVRAIEVFSLYESERREEHIGDGPWREMLKRILKVQGIWFDNDGTILENPVAIYVEKARVWGNVWNEKRQAELELAWEHFDAGQREVASVVGGTPSQMV